VCLCLCVCVCGGRGAGVKRSDCGLIGRSVNDEVRPQCSDSQNQTGAHF